MDPAVRASSGSASPRSERRRVASRAPMDQFPSDHGGGRAEQGSAGVTEMGLVGEAAVCGDLTQVGFAAAEKLESLGQAEFETVVGNAAAGELSKDSAEVVR